MDQDRGIDRFAEVFLAGFISLFFGYTSYGDLQFAFWSKTADAIVTRTDRYPSSKGKGPPMLGFEYQFTDADGTVRSGRGSTEVYFEPHQGQHVTVKYLPGVADSHRLLRHSSLLTVYVFIGCLGLFALSVYRLWRGAKRAAHGTGRRRSNREIATPL